MKIIYQIITPIIAGLIAYLLWKIKSQKEQINNIQNQLSEKKYLLYSNIIYLVFDIIQSGKTGKKISDKEMLDKLFIIKRDMFLYPTDDIFRTFTKWCMEISIPGNNIKHFKTYYNLLKLIRIDMGHKETKIEFDEFMLFLMQNEEEYNKIKFSFE